MIGYFGDIIFETSAQKVLNFRDFSRETNPRIEKHNRINKKPLLEFIGPDLDTISLTINLNFNLGVNVQEELKKLQKMTDRGEAEILVIAGNIIGSDKWVIKSKSEAWNTVYSNGFLYSASVSIQLEEYISDD